MWRSIKQIVPDQCLTASSFQCLLWSVCLTILHVFDCVLCCVFLFTCLLSFLWSVLRLTILHVFDCFAATRTTLALGRSEVEVQGSRFDRNYVRPLLFGAVAAFRYLSMVFRCSSACHLRFALSRIPFWQTQWAFKIGSGVL